VIRKATTADLPVLRELWHEFDREVPLPPLAQPDEDPEEDLRELDEAVADGIALLAERAGELLGFATASLRGDRHAVLTNLYVRQDARHGGVARALVHDVVEGLRGRGVVALELEVLTSNTDAQAVYERWGFEPYMLTLVADAAKLEQRLAPGGRGGRTFGSVHVQTDDRDAVERAVAKFLPRLGRSAGTEVSEPRNGWVAVYDELCSREPKLLQRLARELSYTSGTPTLAIGVEDGAVVRYSLYDRGGAVDEYLSVPEHFGSLPPGDVIALGANPTVVARLTGADPDEVRRVARTAASPAELPAADDLLRQIATAMRIEGADRGWAGEGGNG
jgi:ribosomal protein S18 acetylase RimI-like enzyme